MAKSDKIVLSDIKLSLLQRRAIDVPTPPEFIKTRPGKGGKELSYVEGGYVVARLNAAFSPIGWQFEVVKETIIADEIWVMGRLTVIDHKNNFRVSKEQYGTKKREDKMMLGDALKGAATDALKKCASYFGIALDVYWDKLSDDEKDLVSNPAAVQRRRAKGKVIDAQVVDTPSTAPVASDPNKMFERAKVMIKNTADFPTLANYDTKIKSSTLYTEEQKKELGELIQKQIDGLES